MNLLLKIKLMAISMALTLPLLAQQPLSDCLPDYLEARREQLDALRIYKMTEYLNLSENQAVIFYPRLNAFENNIRQKQQQQMRIIREINRKLQEGNFKPADTDVQKYSRQLAEAEREMIQEKEKFINELGNVLTPEQQLRYLIFEARFRQRLIRSLGIKHEPQKP